MKKLMIVTVLLLFAGIAIGQTLQKGNLIGMHVLTVELKTGVTLDQYIAFWQEKFIPAWEKADKDVKMYPLKAIRGEDDGELGTMVVYKNEAARDKYYNEDGSATDFNNKVMEQLAPMNAEMEKLGTWTSTYTDWIVQ